MTETTLTLPDSYNGEDYVIDDRAFKNDSSITSVMISNGVKSIGENAFTGCSNLVKVVLGENVQSIGCCAFQDCTELSSIEIPHENIKASLFSFVNCNKLSENILDLFIVDMDAELLSLEKIMEDCNEIIENCNSEYLDYEF